MPTQKGRGGKKTRKAKRGGEGQREIQVKTAGQEYGKVTKLLGNSNCMIYCFDQKQRIGKVCGQMRKRVWLKVDDIVLVSMREFEDSDRKCDILLKYYPEEAKELKAIGELPEDLEIEDKKDDPDFYQTKITFQKDEDNAGDNDDDDEDDLPPNSSDEEAWDRVRTRAAYRKQHGNDEEEEGDEEDDGEEEEGDAEAEADDAAKKDAAKAAPAKVVPGAKPVISNVAPKKPVEAPVPVPVPVKANKVDLKNKDVKRKKDMDKKRAGRGGSDSESDKSRDRIDDI